MATIKIVVPRGARAQILNALHSETGAAHFGFKKTYDRLRARFFFWRLCPIRTCTCAPATLAADAIPGPRNRATLQNIRTGYPFERIAMDFLGPFKPTQRGNKYILVIVDHYTKWPECFALPSQDAASVARILVNEWFAQLWRSRHFAFGSRITLRKSPRQTSLRHVRRN